MSSFTSSSNVGLSRAVVGVLVVVALLEVLTREELVTRSRDLSRFRSYPARAERLTSQKGFRVAIFGNSAMEKGVEPDLLAAELRRRLKREVDVEIFTADSSHINTWRYMIRTLLVRPGRSVDIVLVGFFGTSLADENSLELGRLAQFFTVTEDWSEVMTHVTGVGERIEFIISSFWATFALRDRIKQRLLLWLVPKYREYETWIHEGTRNATRRSSEAPSFRLLDAVLQEFKGRICFVALPTRWILERPLEAAVGASHIEGKGGCVIDLRRTAGLQPRELEDEIHLAEAGRVRVTKALVEDLGERLR